MLLEPTFCNIKFTSLMLTNKCHHWVSTNSRSKTKSCNEWWLFAFTMVAFIWAVFPLYFLHFESQRKPQHCSAFYSFDFFCASGARNAVPHLFLFWKVCKCMWHIFANSFIWSWGVVGQCLHDIMLDSGKRISQHKISKCVIPHSCPITGRIWEMNQSQSTKKWQAIEWHCDNCFDVLLCNVLKTACLTTQEMIYQFQQLAEKFQQFVESTFSSLCEFTHSMQKVLQSEFWQFTENVCIKCAPIITHNIYLNCVCCCWSVLQNVWHCFSWKVVGHIFSKFDNETRKSEGGDLGSVCL